MGDTAEEVFEEVAPFGNLIRLGWNRPNIYMGDMSIVLKHMPDYYSGGYLIEVMGMGRDGILKLKLDKWKALKFWNGTGNEVALFVWNSSLKEYALIQWVHLRRLVARGRSAGIAVFSSDGNEYYPIQWNWIVDLCRAEAR
jgi:hypothetical protein